MSIHLTPKAVLNIDTGTVVGERKAGLHPLIEMTDAEEKDVENLLEYTHEVRGGGGSTMGLRKPG